MSERTAEDEMTPHCMMCGGRGEVYDGPRITWKPCPLCGGDPT